MRKTFFVPTLLMFLLSCTSGEDFQEESMEISDGEEEIIEETPESSNDITRFTEVIPLRARIGDTITVKGKHLDSITHVQFNNEFGIFPIVSQEKEEIKLRVPVLYNENVIIKGEINSIPIDSISLNLIGTFPLRFDFGGEDIQSVQILNDNVAYATTRQQLYKTIDGGYNWELIYGTGVISSMYFANENNGWIATYGNTDLLDYTSNGSNFIGVLIPEAENGDKAVIDMSFSSNNFGYLVTEKGEILKANSFTDFEIVYDFPNSYEIGGFREFEFISNFNDIVMATGQAGNNNTPTLIIGQNDNFEFITMENYVYNVQMLSENEAFLVMGNQLYHSLDRGANWEKTSEKEVKDFYFISNQNGVSVSYNESRDRDIISVTYDGGATWTNQFNLRNFEFALEIDFHENVGLISGYRGLMWKHIFE